MKFLEYITKKRHKWRYFGNALVDKLKPSGEISALDLTCSKASSAFQSWAGIYTFKMISLMATKLSGGHYMDTKRALAGENLSLDSQHTKLSTTIEMLISLEKDSVEDIVSFREPPRPSPWCCWRGRSRLCVLWFLESLANSHTWYLLFKMMLPHPFKSQPCLPRGWSLYLVHLWASSTKQIEFTSVAGNQAKGQRQLKANQASWKKSFAETVVTTAWNMEEIH